jgi:hypothetical protein
MTPDAALHPIADRLRASYVEIRRGDQLARRRLTKGGAIVPDRNASAPRI